MRMRLAWLVCLLALITAAVDSARILAFFPLPAKSHHFVFRPILEELARRGHQVVYYTGLPYDTPPANLTQVNLLPHFLKLMGDENKFDQVSFGEMSVPMAITFLYEFGLIIGDTVLGCPPVQELIQSSDEHFDAVMFESYFVQEYQSAFLHRFGAVGIEVMPLGDCSWVNEMTGLPDNTAYQIDYKNENTNVLSFWSRLYNSYVDGLVTLVGYVYLWRMQSLVNKYFKYPGSEGMPSLMWLASNRSLVLTNSHHAVGYPVPLAPHRKEVGGVNIRPNKPLPKELKEFMDKAPSGRVIYMSLGSNINVSDVTNDQLLEDFMSVFRNRPESVLFKWEKEGNMEIPPNVKVASWFPQQDILAHKNLRLFITHGGILSINEAAHHGVPLFGIPFFGDQAKNLLQVEAAGWGRMVRYRNLTKTSISWAIDEILSNERYQEEAARRSRMFRDRMLSPVEEAAYWVEYAIKYPNALTPRAAFLPFYQLHRLDQAAFLAAVLSAVLALVACCLCRARKAKPAPKLKKN